MKTTENRIVILPNKAVEETASGIILPEVAQTKIHMGQVIITGPGLYEPATQDYRPMEVKVGDMVVYAHHSGADLRVAEVEYRVMRESEVLLVM